MKVKINSTIAVPLEMKELYRQIQRAEQLTVSINLQVRNRRKSLENQRVFISEKLTRQFNGSRSTSLNKWSLHRRKAVPGNR